LLEITGTDGSAAQLRDAGEIKAAGETLGGHNSPYSRALLHDDAVYLTFDSAIWAAFWSEPEAARGPIVLDPKVCGDGLLQEGLDLTITSASTQAVNVCDTKVTATYAQYVEQLTPVPASRTENSCRFLGLWGRPGDYSLVVQLPGHESSKLFYWSLPGNICDVLPSRVTFTLDENQ
jgi:hypothetical protein